MNKNLKVVLSAVALAALWQPGGREVPHAAAPHRPGPGAPEQHGYPGLRDRPEAQHRPRSADSL